MPGTYTHLLYHFVFATKHRCPLIDPHFQDELYRYVGGIIRRQKGLLLEAGGMPDHVHLLVNLPPTISLSDALRGIKANSSKWINERDDMPTKFGWQDGYAAFSVSLSQKPRVMNYIRNQARHHRERDFKEELLMLLERNRIAYDARFLWD